MSGIHHIVKDRYIAKIITHICEAPCEIVVLYKTYVVKRKDFLEMISESPMLIYIYIYMFTRCAVLAINKLTTKQNNMRHSM